MQDRKIAIEALFAGILDGGFMCTKKPSASPCGLTDETHASRMEAKQEVGRSGCWQLARKVDAGHEMRRHGDLLVICMVSVRYACRHIDSSLAREFAHKGEI